MNVMRWVVCAVMASACADLVGPEGTAESSQPTETRIAPGAAAEVEPDLRRAWIEAVQAEASEAYWVHASGGRGFVAGHPSAGSEVHFGEDAVQLRPAADLEQDWHLRVHLAGLGRQGRLEPVATARPEVERNRVRYERGAVTEWYVHGPLGLEQGFTIAQRPPGTGALELEIGLGGTLRGELIDGGEAIALRDEDGERRVRYSDLYVLDADGRALEAHLTVTVGENRIGIVVDDRQARYPVVVDPLMATELKVTASDGRTGDAFGSAVAIDGDTSIVGAFHWDTDALRLSSGAAYVFVRSGSRWVSQARLTASDPGRNAFFGFSVAIEGDTALVGAHGAWTGGISAGAAYVFVRSGTSWTEQARLVASGPADASADFGRSVSLSGDTALIGSDSGSAYAFVRSGTLWTEQAELQASGGAGGFGWSVSLSGDTAVVGAPMDDDRGADSGSAYVFVRSGTAWMEQAKLLAPTGAAGDWFGYSLAVNGDMAVIGARRDDDLGADSGAAEVFVRSGSMWMAESRLLASDGAAGSSFGSAVALSGNVAVIGASGHDGPFDASGAGYVFVRTLTGWVEGTKLQASDSAMNYWFGRSAAVADGTAVVGAVGSYGRRSESGAAYIYRLSAVEGLGSPCVGPRDCMSNLCVDGVCCDTACGGGDARDCQACSILTGATGDGTCEPLATPECSPGDAGMSSDAGAAADAGTDAAMDADSAMPMTDAGIGTDAALPPADGGSVVDSGTGIDSGTMPPPRDDAGCGCIVVGDDSLERHSKAGWLLLLVVGLVAGRRLRRCR